MLLRMGWKNKVERSCMFKTGVWVELVSFGHLMEFCFM
jgi:hypothetical protein